MSIIKFAIPKGSLEEATFQFLAEAGYNISSGKRSYRPKISDQEISLKMLRPQEIPVYISEGVADIAITGEDWIRETKANVEILTSLEYGRVKLVAGAPKDLPADSLSDVLQYFWSKNRNIRISTEYLKICSDWIKSNPVYKKKYGDKDPLIITPWWKIGDNPKVSIFLSFGATEAKTPEISDIIMDVTETGTTLSANNIKIMEIVMESYAVLIANKDALSDPIKREKIYDVLALFRGVVSGRKNLHIFVNVKKENLQKLLSALPALKKPTISPLSNENWLSINTVVDKQKFLKLLPNLRKFAQGLVVHEPRQILSLDELPNGVDSEE
ncbi:MAG TPA: ATP phosphoribosyltransferase [Nitrososphaerales archaeon]|nr:ATP phosphoribosyltransferase [Nitrososphaerales archaeon]